MVASLSLHAGTPGPAGDAVLSAGGEARGSGEPRRALGTGRPRATRLTRQRQTRSTEVPLLTPVSREARRSGLTAAATAARESRGARRSG